MSPRGLAWWQRAWDLHNRSRVRVRVCTPCKRLGFTRSPGPTNTLSRGWSFLASKKNKIKILVFYLILICCPLTCRSWRICCHVSLSLSPNINFAEQHQPHSSKWSFVDMMIFWFVLIIHSLTLLEAAVCHIHCCKFASHHHEFFLVYILWKVELEIFICNFHCWSALRFCPC